MRARPVVGLVLTGGGARAAYQVGVLQALTELLPRNRNPFPVIAGTSAGAVSASVLASQAYHWRTAVAGLTEVWSNFRVSQVFKVDTGHMLLAGARWLTACIRSSTRPSSRRMDVINDAFETALALAEAAL